MEGLGLRLPLIVALLLLDAFGTGGGLVQASHPATLLTAP